jgi:hypothetical protein
VAGAARVMGGFCRNGMPGFETPRFDSLSHSEKEVIMLTLVAKVWGWIFVAVGVLGFIPAFTPEGHLLGLFHVNAAHNLIHLLTGAAALWAGYTRPHAAKLYFLWFGIVYGVVAILGFIAGDKPLLGLVANNIADAWLHLGIGAVSIGLGLVPETTQFGRKHAV